jgi:hypothetical protein
VSGSNRNGRVNVAFDGGVKTVTIKYYLTNRVTSGTNRIYISPISVRPVPPPPPVNEDGLSFTKEVKKQEITTCETAEYKFIISNTTCEDKYVTFTDTIPDDVQMTWDIESLKLDTINDLYNPHITVHNYGGTKGLRIDSLRIPRARRIEFSVSALLDEDAEDGRYDNQAKITYERMVDSNLEIQNLMSVDRYSLEPFTTFEHTWAERQLEVTMDVKAAPVKYSSSKEIEMTYTFENPNDPITDSFLELDFNEGFTYVAGSASILSTPGPTPTTVCYIDDSDPGDIPPALTIVGGILADDELAGFTLPTGTTVIKIRLKAPDKLNLEPEYDDEGNLTGNIAALEVYHNFVSEMEDPCILMSIRNLSGVKVVPFAEITHIKTNKNITVKLKTIDTSDQ